MGDDEIRRLREAYTAISRGDAETLGSLVAHDIEWTLPDSLPWGGTRHGPDGIAAMVEIFTEHVDGVFADPDDFIDAGDQIVVLGRLRGCFRSCGEDYEVPFAHVWGLSDGVPNRFRGYLDTAPILELLNRPG